MPLRPWRRRVQDILDQIDKTLRDTAALSRDEYDRNEVLQDAVGFRISIIGEAVAAIPEEVRLRHPTIPWRDIRNMPNVLSHVYFLIDQDRVWEVIQIHMPALRTQLLDLLQAEHPESPES